MTGLRKTKRNAGYTAEREINAGEANGFGFAFLMNLDCPLSDESGIFEVPSTRRQGHQQVDQSLSIGILDPEVNATPTGIRKPSGFHRCYRRETMADRGASHGGRYAVDTG
jgi:hypothetical protein